MIWNSIHLIYYREERVLTLLLALGPSLGENKGDEELELGKLT